MTRIPDHPGLSAYQRQQEEADRLQRAHELQSEIMLDKSLYEIFQILNKAADRCRIRKTELGEIQLREIQRMTRQLEDIQSAAAAFTLEEAHEL